MMKNEKVMFCIADIFNNGVDNLLEKVVSVESIETLIFALDECAYGLYHEEYDAYALVEYDDYSEENDVIKLSFNDKSEYFTLEQCKERLTIRKYPD